MRIGIIFAMDCELKGFEKFLDKIKCNHEINTYVCGIGKVNSALTTTRAIVEDDCDYIINCGVAGGINNAKQFDVYYGVELAYSDVDCTAINYELGQVPRMPVKYYANSFEFNFSEAKRGNILSQDSFANDKQKEFFKKYFSDYTVVDMESCSIAQTCCILNTPFSVVRSISDEVFEPNNFLAYEKAEEKACEKAALTLVELLNQV